MEREQHYINISAPNLVNVCVDESMDGDISGRMYHCYQKEPFNFANLIQLLRQMEELFDGLAFPQSSTTSRSFLTVKSNTSPKICKVTDQKNVMRQSGGKATFIVSVQYRQNSTWQGEMLWVEKEKTQTFSSTLDFIKIIDSILMSVEM